MLQLGELPERVYSTLGIAEERSISASALQGQRHRQRALSSLARLREVDDALALARQATVALQEDKALRALARAEQALRETLELPGASVFYAELQLQLGVSAAHSGMYTLAEAAFARAASIDPARRLLAGEAAPDVVLLAERAFERVASAREGTLHITVNVAAARVFIDDRALGEAPLAARMKSGLHVLRVEADGHATYARLFELLEGERPVSQIVLSPDPDAIALRALDAAIASHAADAIQAACGQVLGLEPRLGLLLFGERTGAHGWFARCERETSTLSTYAIDGRAPLHIRRVERFGSSALTDARAWLTPERSVVEATQAAAPQLWQRWYVWAVAGAVVVGAGVWVGAAMQPDPQRSLRVSVDPSALR